MKPEIILEMASEIESLSKLCADLILELEQYKAVDEEERRYYGIITSDTFLLIRPMRGVTTSEELALR